MVVSNSAVEVDIDKVIWTMLVDRNDEMETRANDAKWASRTDEDANRLVNSRDTAAMVVVVPQSLSFYTMFYKMIIEDRYRGRREEEEEEGGEEEKKKSIKRRESKTPLGVNVRGYARA